MKMKKTFCDCCGNEITESNDASAHSGLVHVMKIANKPSLHVQVLIGNANEEKGDFCKYCVIKAVNQLDDRPRRA